MKICHQRKLFSVDQFFMKAAEKFDMEKVPRGIVNWQHHGGQSSVRLRPSVYCLMLLVLLT